MPKLKTTKSVSKRVKLTKKGKIKRGRPGRRHLLSVKTSKRRRKLRKGAFVQAKYVSNFTEVIAN